MSDAIDLPDAHKEASLTRVRDDRGLIYPFDSKPEPGEAIEVAPGVLWLRMKMPMQLDHINVWLLEDGDGWASSTPASTSRAPRTRGRWCSNAISAAAR